MWPFSYLILKACRVLPVVPSHLLHPTSFSIAHPFPVIGISIPQICFNQSLFPNSTFLQQCRSPTRSPKWAAVPDPPGEIQNRTQISIRTRPLKFHAKERCDESRMSILCYVRTRGA